MNHIQFTKYDSVFLLGLLFWLLETWYFGFNDTPGSGTEKAFDILSAALMGYGAINSVLLNLLKPTIINIVNNGPTPNMPGNPVQPEQSSPFNQP